MEWMKTNRVCNDSIVCANIMDVDNGWNDRSKHLSVSSTVFSTVGQKKFDPTTSFESAIQATSYNIVLFETTGHIFANE